MPDPKTRPTQASAAAFLARIPDAELRADCKRIAGMMAKATRSKARMWGAGIVGFGTYQLTYASGRQADWMQIGFAPRAKKVTIYMRRGFPEYAALMAKLGKHTKSGSCLHIKRLADVHLPTLEKLVTKSVRHVRKQQSA